MMARAPQDAPTIVPVEPGAKPSPEPASLPPASLPPPPPERRGWHGRPASHLWRRQNTRSKRGALLNLGYVLSLALLGIVSTAAASWYADTMVSQKLEHKDAAMMRKLQRIVNMYVQENYGRLVEQTRTTPVELPMDDIKFKFADPWIEDTTHLGGKMHAYVKQEPFGPEATPYLWVYLVPQGGRPYERNRQGLAARNTGVFAWFTRDSEPGVGVGIWSKWKAPINADLAPLSVSVPTGIVGLYYPFAPGDLAFDYLHRYAVPGQPWLNAMNQDLDMNHNDIINIRTGRMNALHFVEIHATHGQPCTPFQYRQTDGSMQYGSRLARSDADGNLAMCVYEEDIGQWYWRNLGLLPGCTPDQLITADATNLRCAPNPYYRVPINVQYSACNACTSGVQTLISWQCQRLPDGKIMDVNSPKCQAIAPSATLACNNPSMCTPPPPPPTEPQMCNGQPMYSWYSWTVNGGESTGDQTYWCQYQPTGGGGCQCVIGNPNDPNQQVAGQSGDQNGGGNTNGVGAAGDVGNTSGASAAAGSNPGNTGSEASAGTGSDSGTGSDGTGDGSGDGGDGGG